MALWIFYTSLSYLWNNRVNLLKLLWHFERNISQDDVDSSPKVSGISRVSFLLLLLKYCSFTTTPIMWSVFMVHHIWKFDFFFPQKLSTAYKFFAKSSNMGHLLHVVVLSGLRFPVCFSCFHNYSEIIYSSVLLLMKYSFIIDIHHIWLSIFLDPWHLCLMDMVI